MPNFKKKLEAEKLGIIFKSRNGSLYRKFEKAEVAAT
jgi:hypothetical protein